MNTSTFPALLQRFFTERLLTQQGASPHTVAGYRDTFRLLFRFATERLGRAPSALRLEQLDAAFLETFLEHLERDRGNRPRTRNQRLSALHGFFRYGGAFARRRRRNTRRWKTPRGCDRGQDFLSQASKTSRMRD
jgi:integrase/recombinase XerD